MNNTIKITQCDNQLLLVAVQEEHGYLIANIQSGNTNAVDITLNIESGEYTKAYEADGVNNPISDNAVVTLPAGKYSLVYVGMNWGAAYNFEMNFKGEDFKLENDPSKNLVGAIWNRGNLDITFEV